MSRPQSIWQEPPAAITTQNACLRAHPVQRALYPHTVDCKCRNIRFMILEILETYLERLKSFPPRHSNVLTRPTAKTGEPIKVQLSGHMYMERHNNCLVLLLRCCMMISIALQNSASYVLLTIEMLSRGSRLYHVMESSENE